MRLSYGGHFKVNELGHLEVEGWDTVELAEKFGTPLRVVSENTIRENFRRFKKAFSDRYSTVDVAYASKANHTPAIVKILHTEGALVDAVGRGQMNIALQAGVDPSEIIFNGNNKTDEELEAAIGMGVGYINVDSLSELSRVEEIAAKLDVEANVNIRLKPSFRGLEQSDPEFVKGMRASKFGIDVASGQALKACKIAMDSQHINFRGLHNHIGFTAYGIPYSVELDLRRHREAVKEVMEVAGEVKEKFGHELEVIDLGGGFRLSRREGFGPGIITASPSLETYADNTISTLKAELEKHDLKEPNLLFESGGFMVTNAEVLLSRVGDVKEVTSGPAQGKWVAVDSSAYFFVRKLIFDFYHHTIVANKADREAEEVVDIVGPICAYDYVADKISIPKVERGDLIATFDQGSYCEVISSHYCEYPEPATVLVCGDSAEVIRRRETIQDLYGRYITPSRLFSSVR